MGPSSWQYGKKIYSNPESLSKLLQDEVNGLRTPGNVTAWMDLVRTVRHPQQLWAIDYIKPLPELTKINDIILKSEQILYGSTTNLKLKDGYRADIFQEIAFHTIRAHLRAEEGNFGDSICIFKELLDEWYDKLPIIRQSNLLMHCCLAFLCCNKWEESYQCLQKHWGILKYCDPVNRDLLGIWDNEIIIRQIYWFFMQHVVNFRSFYAAKLGIPASGDLWNHKKIGLLYLQSYDDSWVVSFCSLAFYNHARETMPILPEYKPKRSTPINVLKLNVKDKFDEHEDMTVLHRQDCDWQNNGCHTRDQDQYLARYLKMSQQDYRGIDPDKLDDYLFSYYSYEYDDVSRAHSSDNAFYTLCAFLEELYPGSNILDSPKSLIDCGCGTMLQRANYSFLCDYVGVDISERVCNVLQEDAPSRISESSEQIKLSNREINCVHSSINRYFRECGRKFDLCLAASVLPCLDLDNVKQFVDLSSKACNRVAACINTKDDIRNETGHNINLHRTVLTSEKWIDLISQKFDVKHKTTGDVLLLYGFSKNS